MKIFGYDKLGRPVLNGGKGSGNFGHSGRPGLQGGSAGEGTSRGSSRASKATVDKKELADSSTDSIKKMRKGASRTIVEMEEEISTLKKSLEEGKLEGRWKENAEARVKRLEEQLEKEKADREVYDETLKERGDSSYSESKSAKDFYKESYPKDYQNEDIPDKPIDKLTDKDIEHLDTQVRERLMKEKRKATGKQTYEDAEEAYYDKLDKTSYYDLNDDLYDKGADNLRYSLSGLVGHYSALLHDEVTTTKARKEYKEEIKEMTSDIEKYAKDLDDEKLKKRVLEVVDFIKDAPTDFEKNNMRTRLDSLLKITNGGKGSGNFGHGGRPGL